MRRAVMDDYKHFSFDLWLTLIKSNPLFKKRRSEFFHREFNLLSLPLEEVEHLFRRIDLLGNAINERTGKNIEAEELYLMVISSMNNWQADLHTVDTEQLYQQMELLLLEHLPLVYDDDTVNFLSTLKSRGKTTNILSNTGFVKGCTLRKVLQELYLAEFFDFQIYSDEEGLSKPNKVLFQVMIDKAKELASIEAESIVHVGDNPRADIEGARQAGIKGILINSNHQSITDLIYATSQVFPS